MTSPKTIKYGTVFIKGRILCISSERDPILMCFNHRYCPDIYVCNFYCERFAVKLTPFMWKLFSVNISPEMAILTWQIQAKVPTPYVVAGDKEPQSHLHKTCCGKTTKRGLVNRRRNPGLSFGNHRTIVNVWNISWLHH